MNKKSILKFLNKNKFLVGLGDYAVFIMEPTDKENSAECTVYPELLNKTLKISPSKELWSKATDGKLKSVLMHELIHARLSIFAKQKDMLIEEIIDTLEEELANDLERGFMSLMGIDTQEESIKFGADKNDSKKSQQSTIRNNRR